MHHVFLYVFQFLLLIKLHLTNNSVNNIYNVYIQFILQLSAIYPNCYNDYAMRTEGYPLLRELAMSLQILMDNNRIQLKCFYI